MTFPLDAHPSNGFAGSGEVFAIDSGDIPENTNDLIAFILDRYHSVHRKELPGLIELARKVESVHAGHPDVPGGLADFLEGMADNLESHMQKEERILFPLCASGGHPSIGHPIAMMRMEHVDHTESLAALAGIAGGFQVPEGACNSWQTLYAGLQKLSDDLTAHIRTENEILFPRFGA